jgi:hypothetical protein
LPSTSWSAASSGSGSFSSEKRAAPAAAAARLVAAKGELGDLRRTLALIGLDLQPVQHPVAVAVVEPEGALGVGLKLGGRDRPVMIGVGLGEPGDQPIRSAERLARGADEQVAGRAPAFARRAAARRLASRRQLDRRGLAQRRMGRSQ